MPDRVKFTGSSEMQVRWGGNDDPTGLLVEGCYYTVLNREVHGFHTKLTLKEYPTKKFNSVCFEEV